MEILQVTMEAAFPEKLADFYETLMQLPVQSKRGEVYVEIGASVISFRQAGFDAHPFYHFAINIPSDKIEEARTWLLSKLGLLWIADYKSEVADFRNWNAKSVYFYDAAGNIVELIARRDLGNASTEIFSSKQLLSVSEIGIVCPAEDIDKNTEALMRRTGLAYFNRQPPLQHFKAVGDDEGLFIIVPEGRNWYPTADKPAGRYPLQVKFQVEGRQYQESF